MKKIVFTLFVLAPCLLIAQTGIKAGLNFANITNAEEINSSSETGYHAGVFFAGPVKKFLSSQTELIYSKQGYNYKTSENSGNVNLKYLSLNQFVVFNFTKFVQLQAGGYIAYLTNAKVDSTQTSTGNSSVDKILDYMNKFDYGFSGGVEIHPIHLLVAGARINFSLGELYQDIDELEAPPFIPDLNAKNNLFQIYVGLKFGKEEE